MEYSTDWNYLPYEFIPHVEAKQRAILKITNTFVGERTPSDSFEIQV